MSGNSAVADGVNDLADAATNQFSDHEGCTYQQTNFRAVEAKHKAICLRLATLEAAIRKSTPERTRNEADIITAAREKGERHRMHSYNVTASSVNKALSARGHHLFLKSTPGDALSANPACTLSTTDGRPR